MEPTPPKGSRNKRFAQNRPFYESSKKTSAEIISEARSTVRPLQTRRPETPLDLNNRTLFGKQREGRPPSAVSISSSFHDSRPPSGKGKLTPLANVPDFKELELRLEEKFTIDKNSNEIGNDNNNNNNSAKKQMKIKGNIIPKSAEPSFSRARRSIKSSKVVEERRVHSGPKERPPIFRDDDLKRSNSYSDLTSTDEKVTETKHSSNEQIDSDSFYNTNIEPLINQMHLNYEYGDIESLLVNLDFLWRVLEVSNMVGQNAKIAREHRAAILTKLSSYVNNKNALLQLRICKLYLGLKVTKRNLSAVCKSFYQVTKNEKNDDMVLQEKMIEPILTILNNPEQVDSTTDLVYLVGALKILSNQPKCSKEIRLLDLLTPLKCLLQFSVKKYTSAVQIKESNHMLIQASSLLNNLADSATLANQFIENNILQLLMDLMKARLDDVDLIMPIASIFSKLTISESICNNVVEVESNPGLLMNTLIKHTNTQEIVVRFGYAFGNMANHSPKFRDIILSSNDMTKNFVKVIRFYTKKLRKDRSQTDLTESSKECEEDEDVLVKVCLL
uniref:Uncharacterized protein n=2 Tax=Clytia hemisphaerica TaxID=252671 RepID=A0A7M5WK95_9CNID